MPETKHLATKKKITRRRDDDPVKIFKDFRVGWWPSGIPGVGKRKLDRTGSAEKARAFAEARYAEIDRHRARGPLSHVALGEVWLRYVKYLRDTDTPLGTTNQYRSNWNCHVPEEVADISCGDLDVSHWTRIFEEMLTEGATKQTMRAVSRTLGALLTYAEDRNYFGDRDPFRVSGDRRGKVVARLAKKAPEAADQERIGTEHCPAPATIHRFAGLAERVLPGYGFLMVLLAFASGLRFTECLGLRIEHIDLSTGQIRVVQQLNRYESWPAVAPPKGGKFRTVRIWAAYEWVLHRLVEQAATHTGDHAGWLFPPDRQVKRWADRVNRLINQDAVALFNEGAHAGAHGDGGTVKWDWTFHWLRHAFASYGLASKDQGGLGFSVTYVQRQLGHKKPSTTTDKYQAPLAGEDELAREMSERVPWEVLRSPEATTAASTAEVA